MYTNIFVTVALIAVIIGIVLTRVSFKKIALKTSLRSSTQLDIDYILPDESGTISIAKIGDCYTPVIRSTLTGWRVEVPLSYTAHQISDYIKSLPDQTHIKNTHQNGINFLVIIFGGQKDPKSFMSLPQKDREVLTNGILEIKSHMRNFTKLLPDINFAP